MKSYTIQHNIISAFIVICISSILLSCGSPAQKVDSAQDKAAKAAEELSVAQANYKIEFDNFKQESKIKIDANDARISNLKKEKDMAKKDKKADYDKKIADLEEKNADLRSRIDNYNVADKEKWQSFKTEFNHDMDELGKALNDFATDNEK